MLKLMGHEVLVLLEYQIAQLVEIFISSSLWWHVRNLTNTNTSHCVKLELYFHHSARLRGNRFMVKIYLHEADGFNTPREGPKSPSTVETVHLVRE